MFFWLFFYLNFREENLFSFNQPDHIYYPAGTLIIRNYLISWAFDSRWNRLFFFLPIAYSTLSLIVTPLKKKIYYLMYPLTFIFMLPLWLIEPRYSIIPIVMFILFRKTESRLVELSILSLFIILSAALYVGLIFNRAFL